MKTASLFIAVAGALVSVKRGLKIVIRPSEQLHKEPEPSHTENLSEKNRSNGRDTHQLVLVAWDFDFADIRNYPPEAYVIVVLELPEDVIVARANEVLKSFVSNKALLGRLKGRLAIVESWRGRFRPAETS